MICLNCSKETKNPKFCNNSCAATYNNKVNPKRHKESKGRRKCKVCDNVLTGRSIYCSDDCKQSCMKRKIVKSKRVGRNVYTLPTDTWQMARKIYSLSGLEYKCAVCGYDNHVQICHIKPVYEFPKDTPKSIINDMDNLVALCPNCHWELDNHHIVIEQTRL